MPDYLRFGVSSTLRLFEALTRFPTLDRLLDLPVPTLTAIRVVLERDRIIDACLDVIAQHGVAGTHTARSPSKRTFRWVR